MENQNLENQNNNEVEVSEGIYAVENTENGIKIADDVVAVIAGIAV